MSIYGMVIWSLPIQHVIIFCHNMINKVTDFSFLFSKITVDGDFSHEIKRCLPLEEKLWQTFSSVQWLTRVWLFATPWTTAHQPSQSINNSQSLPKLMSIELVMPSNHLILCPPLPSPPAFNLFQHQGLFKWVSSSHQVAKVLEFQLQHHSFQWTPRTDLL